MVFFERKVKAALVPSGYKLFCMECASVRGQTKIVLPVTSLPHKLSEYFSKVYAADLLGLLPRVKLQTCSEF